MCFQFSLRKRDEMPDEIILNLSRDTDVQLSVVSSPAPHRRGRDGLDRNSAEVERESREIRARRKLRWRLRD